MKRRWCKAMSLLVVMAMMPFALLLSASVLESQEILIKYKATVLEETKDHIIIKFYKTDIGLVTEKGSATQTISSQLSPDRTSSPASPSGQSLSRTELKNEILQELRGEIQKEATKGIGPIEYGSVEGRIMRRGVGEPQARVKLVRWVQEASLLGIFKELKKGAEFETTTDQDGRYAFQNIPVGAYELKWLAKGSDAWIRRLTERPDVAVKKGATVTARAVELSGPVLP